MSNVHQPPATTARRAIAPRPFSLFARDPFRSFDSMRQWMDTVFDNELPTDFQAVLQPAVNVYEKDGIYTIECALPGYKKDDIKVEARGEDVTLSGSYTDETKEDKNHYHRHELRQGSFTRTIVLPQQVDPDSVSAKLENGMLRVTLRPTSAVKTKTVPVT